MRRYGSYEAVLELHRSALSTIWSAQSAFGDGRTLAVKVIEPSALILGSEQAAREQIERFLSAAALQKRMSDAPHWAPVYETGSEDGAAFYVTDQYKRSVRQLVMSHVDLPEAALHHLITAVAHGLRELKDRESRAHGNLKPTNVLLGEGRELAAVDVALTDPLAGEVLREGSEEEADLRAVGRLLCQLVTHEAPGGVGWVAPDSPQWSKLGRRGAAWRELCNRLLSYDAENRIESIEALEAELENLAPQPSRLNVPLIAGAAGLLLLVGLLSWWIVTPTEPPKPINHAAVIEELTTQHHNWAWVLEPGKDQLLQELMSEEERLSSLEDHLGSGLDGAFDAATPQELDREHDRFAGAEQAIGSWLDALERDADRYAQRAWTGMASALDAAVADVRKSISMGNFDVELMGLRDVLRNIRLIDQRWQRIQEHAEQVTAVDVPLLTEFHEFASRRAKEELGDEWESDDPDAPSGLGELEQISGQLAAFLIEEWHRYNQELASADSPVTLEAGEEIAIGHYKQWLTLIRQRNCYQTPDPRDQDFQSEVEEALTQANESVQQLRQEGYDEERAKITLNTIEEVKHAVSGIRRRPLTCDTLAELQAGVEAIQGDVRDLNEQLREWLAEASTTREEFLETQRNHQVTDSGVLNQSWQDLLEDLDRREESLAALRQNTEELAAGLQRIAEDFPVSIAGASPDRSLLKALRAHREDMLRRAVEERTLTDFLTAQQSRWTTWDESRDEYGRFRDDLTAVVEMTGAIENLLDGLHVFDEPGPDGQSIQQLADEVRSRDVYSDHQAVQQAFTKTMERVEALVNLRSAPRREIIAEARTPGHDPAVRINAWLRLGEVSTPWPGSVGELQEASLVVRDLIDLIESLLPDVDDETRRSHLQQTLLDTSRRRWVDVARSCTSREDLRRALRRRDEFMSPGDEIPSSLQFNEAIHSALSMLERGEDTDDAQAIDIASNLYEKLQVIEQQLPDSSAIVDETIERVRQLAEESGEAAMDPSRIGPGLGDWALAERIDDETLVYQSPTSGRELTFRLVEPENGAPAFVCTTEVSLGLVIEVLNSDNGMAAFEELMDDLRGRNVADSLDDLYWERWGARVWRWENAEIRTSVDWVNSPDRVRPKGARPRGQYSSSILEVPYPTDESPMQQVSPAAAIYVAHRLGCRLPSIDEWRAAYRAAEEPRPSDSTNLRDQTWEDQRAYSSDWSLGDQERRQLVSTLWSRSFRVDEFDQNDRREVWPHDDDVLWFEPVKAGNGPSTFQNLVGNVGEFVLQDAESIEQRLGMNQQSPPLPEQIVSALEELHGNEAAPYLFVIGGSALSPPRLTPDEPYGVPLNEGRSGLPATFTRRAYADVGFRLAFSAEGARRRSVRDRLVEALEDSFVLAASGG